VPKNNVECLLEQILNQLKTPDKEKGQPVRREWFPMMFHLYAKGTYVSDPNYGTSKWGFAKVEPTDLKMDFDYEFDSVMFKTENMSYKPAFQLMINGKRYPEYTRMCSAYTTYTGWKKYTGHNYDYKRCYMAWMVDDYFSNHAHGIYPLKMIVRKPWNFNIAFFATTTSNYWYSVEIMGWKLFYDDAEVLKELENVAKR